jgi:hypothetical protein
MIEENDPMNLIRIMPAEGKDMHCSYALISCSAVL